MAVESTQQGMLSAIDEELARLEFGLAGGDDCLMSVFNSALNRSLQDVLGSENHVVNRCHQAGNTTCRQMGRLEVFYQPFRTQLYQKAFH